MPDRVLCSIILPNGEKVGEIELNAKVFNSGSDGFFGVGKIALEGQRFQSQCQMVRVGSKKENLGA
jgi:hypothetical protein